MENTTPQNDDVPSNLDESIAEAVQRKNEALLAEAADIFGDDWITPPLGRALFTTPRHQFIPRFLSSSDGDWSQIDESNLRLHLDTLYGNHPLCIYRDSCDRALSTISQPSLVLYMISLLDLKPGMKVFELGGGSGWNAALMSRFVGAEGHIHSLEIIPELVENARKSFGRLEIKNVSITHDDACLGLADYAPFHRGVFTASAYDLPHVFFDQIIENGLLLFVAQLDAETDLLALLRKRDGIFVSELHFPCNFVPVIKNDKNGRAALRNHSETAPSIQASMSKTASKRNLDIEDFDLRILPSSKPMSEEPNHWIDRRGDSIFVWSLRD